MTCSYVYERGPAAGTECAAEHCDVHNLPPLPDELVAEGWIQFARLHLLWMHEPSMRTVAIEPVQGAPGFRVVCALRNEHGEPVLGDVLEPVPFADAVRRARAIRRSILDEQERGRPQAVEQGELFDAEARR